MGVSFTLAYSDTTVKKSIDVSTDGQSCVLSLDNYSVLLSSNAGSTWTNITPSTWSQIYPVNYYSPSNTYITNGQQIMVGGSVTMSGDGKYIAAFANGLLVYSKTDKITWTYASIGSTNISSVMASISQDGQYMVAYNVDKSFYYTNNYGFSWNTLSNITTYIPTSLSLSSDGSQYGLTSYNYATNSTGYVYKSVVSTLQINSISNNDIVMNNNLLITKNVYVNTALGYYEPRYMLDVGGNTNINGTLYVNSDVSMNGNLYVQNNTTMNGILFGLNDVSLNSNLYIQNDTTINGRLFGLNDVSLNSKLYVENDTTMLGKLVGLNDVSLNGNVSINKNTTISGNLVVMRDVSFNGNVNVTKMMYINGVQVTTGPSSQWTDVLNGNLYYKGNVGIGGVDPQYTFDVSGITNMRGNTLVRGNLIAYSDVSFNTNLNVGKNIYINGVQVIAGPSSQWTTINNNIYYNGSVAIGKSLNPNYVLDVSGATYITGAVYGTTFTVTSDYRVKENPQLLDASFNVDRLRPLHYTNRLSNKEDLGFIAHEVQEVYPYLVEGNKDDEQNQSLNYTGLIAILVKEIQELKKDMYSLKKENIEIKAQLEKIIK
jgi:hypothetical protein